MRQPTDPQKTVYVRWSPPAIARTDQPWLDAGERRRLDRITRRQARDEFLTSRVLLKTLIAELAQVEPVEVRLGYTCAVCGEPHGRPVVIAPVAATRIQLSLAHSGQRVVVAATCVAPVGVDVEPVAATGFDGFDAVALTPQERRSLRRLDDPSRATARASLWARKEALLKASGEGVALDPTTVEPARSRAQVRGLDVGPAYAAAVAVLTRRPVGVTVLQVNTVNTATTLSAAAEARAEPVRAASDAGAR
jgi:4'-phosphopantetheinyl transferase